MTKKFGHRARQVMECEIAGKDSRFRISCGGAIRSDSTFQVGPGSDQNCLGGLEPRDHNLLLFAVMAKHGHYINLSLDVWLYL